MDVTYIGEKRDRSNDILIIDIRTGNAIVDNMTRYYGLYYVSRTFPGTREYIALRNRREDNIDATA